MCGIVGLIHPKALELLPELNQAICHRGPDDTGWYSFKTLALGHQRLAILDLSQNGHQPMISDDERYVIIYNGEIYNHLEIREQLKHKYTFRSNSDTETILNGFAEFGPALFARLNGIFALAIFDKLKGELTLARDHFGVKPLYYYRDKEAFLFGSEIKSFLKYPGFDKTIDYPAIMNYIHFLWSPGAQTPFEKVKKLPPGHWMRLNIERPDQIELKQYYQIPFTGDYSTKTEKQLTDELEERLFKAVERQLLSDRPVGFFLSGGLDSSAVVAMARQVVPSKSINCYTIDVGSGNNGREGFVNDLPYARAVAKHLGVNLETVNAKPDIIANFDRVIWHLDEPQADSAPINVYNICKKAREDGYAVLLSGAAGDDLFSGYRRHQALYYEKILKLLPGFLLRGAGWASNYLKSNSATIRRLRKLLKDINTNEIDRHSAYFAWISEETNRSLFSEAIRPQLLHYSPSAILHDTLTNIPGEKDSLNKMLFWELKYFLTDHNLNYTDKLSMASGVEVRVPFLDLDLVEFSTRIPPHLKMKGSTTKYLLKKVMERYLPKEIIYRPKTGFGAPVRDWIVNDMQETIQQRLNPERLKQRGIFDPEQVWHLINDNKAGKIDASYVIWSLLAIESWFTQFVDAPTIPAKLKTFDAA